MLLIRRAVSADRAELYRLIRGLFPHLAPKDIEPEIDMYLDADPDTITILAAERPGGGLCGFIEVGRRDYAEGCESSPVPYIEAWFVDADVRRQGVGRELFAAAEAWARDHGYTEIASDAELHNDVSIAAHKALGYEETDRIVTFRRSL
jgi:aminoglycoside 6'-N-acetyltransferase I